ncbi:MAG: helix-turn-helix transcriptional regulator [Gemmatimonadota bacterium]|jgi:DNA-binding PadR family transcriptional regulator
MSRALGGFEQLILLAILRLGDDTHGVAIRREIEARTGKEASTGALYTTLERLEARGLVAARLGDPTPVRGGRRKKLYSLKATGMAAIRESYDAFASMVQGVEAKLIPGDR